MWLLCVKFFVCRNNLQQGFSRIASLNLNRKSFGFSCITFHNKILRKLPQRRLSLKRYKSVAFRAQKSEPKRFPQINFPSNFITINYNCYGKILWKNVVKIGTWKTKRKSNTGNSVRKSLKSYSSQICNKCKLKIYTW